MAVTGGVERASYHVAELDCAEESAALRGALENQAGIVDIGFDLLRARMDVTFHTDRVSRDDILRMASVTGFHVRPWETNVAAPSRSTMRFLVTAMSGVGILAGIGLHWLREHDLRVVLGTREGDGLTWDVQLAYGLAIASGLSMIAGRVVVAIRKLRADMNLLVAIAVAGALGLGDWLEGATVAFLFALALLLDQWSLDRARRAIGALVRLTPTMARRRSAEGRWLEYPVSEIGPGDRVLVHADECIPVDGQVVVGESSVNQGPITGESQPVAKCVGDEVFAATINGEGALEIAVSRRADDTALARILRMVEEAQTRRAPSERFVEKFARYYTPAMIGIALAVAVVPPLGRSMPWEQAFYNALVLLVMACPCALVISTPVTIVSALAAAARHGVLIKGGLHLEVCAHLRAIAFDKTGTLTSGQPSIEKTIAFAPVTESDVLRLAAALESRSNHPLARAIRAEAHQRGLVPPAIDGHRQLRGLGVEGTVEGRRLWLGGTRLLSERSPNDTIMSHHIEAESSAGHSVMVLGEGADILGLVVASDTIRPEARSAIESLRRLGVRHVAMLTGDHRAAAHRVAQAIGADMFRAGASAEEKVDEIIKLRGQFGHVAMVGDGVNDSPALAAASVGIAMGVIGTAAAMETADIGLMTDDLRRIPWLVAHARRATRVVRANLVFAIAVKACFLVLATFGLATLWSAIAADMGASLLVILNGLRLCRDATGAFHQRPLA